MSLGPCSTYYFSTPAFSVHWLLRYIDKHVGNSSFTIFTVKYFLNDLTLIVIIFSLLQSGFLNFTKIALTKVNSSEYFSAFILFSISASVDTPSVWFLEYHFLLIIPWCGFLVLFHILVSLHDLETLAFLIIGFVHSGHSWFILISVCTHFLHELTRPFANHFESDIFKSVFPNFALELHSHKPSWTFCRHIKFCMSKIKFSLLSFFPTFVLPQLTTWEHLTSASIAP